MNTEIQHYRTLLESALVYAGKTHTYEDVVHAVESGEAQFWPGPNSCIVTQIDEQPQGDILHFFLAAGNSKELARMAPEVVEWGKEQGCVKARLVGRKGWLRSFLNEQGWSDTALVIMEKPIE